MKGFVFESNRGTRVPVTAETPLGRLDGSYVVPKFDGWCSLLDRSPVPHWLDG